MNFLFNSKYSLKEWKLQNKVINNCLSLREKKAKNLKSIFLQYAFFNNFFVFFNFFDMNGRKIAELEENSKPIFIHYTGSKRNIFIAPNWNMSKLALTLYRFEKSKRNF